MTIRFSEEEALSLGFKKDERGNWHQSRQREKDTRGLDTGKVPIVERSAGNELKEPDEIKEEGKREGEDGHKYGIIFISYRKRDIDPDNIFIKWHLDELVRAKVIPNDSSKYVDFVLKKVVKSEKEFTSIHVIKLDGNAKS